MLKMTHNISIRKYIYQLFFLLFIFYGNILKAQCNQPLSSILNADNGLIYKLGSEWTFSYQFIPAPNKMLNENSIYANDLNKVKNIVITVIDTPEYIKKRFNLDSTQNFSFEYTYPPHAIVSQSTIIENRETVWVHPPRDYFFKILELNPFPYIKKPIKKGLKWIWKLEIGKHWGDKRWKEWTGNIINVSTYEIVGDTLLSTKLGQIKCNIVQSSAKSEVGITYLTSYFNLTFGFVKLEYINIDSSKIIIELVEWKNRNLMFIK